MSTETNASQVVGGRNALSTSPGLKEKWTQFLGLLLEPFNGSLFVTLVAMYLLGLAELKGAAGVLSQTMLALTAGVLGGRIANALAEVNSASVLRARGTVAVRGLKLLLRNIQAIERRVLVFREGRVAAGESALVEVARLEETIEMVRVLQEEAVSSIENWTDIVPEAHSSTVVGQMTELKLIIEQLQVDKGELAAAIKESEGKSSSELEGLKRAFAERDELASSLLKKLAKLELRKSLETSPSPLTSMQNLGFPTKMTRISDPAPSLADLMRLDELDSSKYKIKLAKDYPAKFQVQFTKDPPSAD